MKACSHCASATVVFITLWGCSCGVTTTMILDVFQNEFRGYQSKQVYCCDTVWTRIQHFTWFWGVPSNQAPIWFSTTTTCTTDLLGHWAHLIEYLSIYYDTNDLERSMVHMYIKKWHLRDATEISLPSYVSDHISHKSLLIDFCPLAAGEFPYISTDATNRTSISMYFSYYKLKYQNIKSILLDPGTTLTQVVFRWGCWPRYLAKSYHFMTTNRILIGKMALEFLHVFSFNTNVLDNIW